MDEHETAEVSENQEPLPNRQASWRSVINDLVPVPGTQQLSVQSRGPAKRRFVQGGTPI